MTGPVPALDNVAKRCADAIRTAESVLVASHIDADGLTSAAIATRALERAAIPVRTTFFKQLDRSAIETIATIESDTVVFTDFGSGQLQDILTIADTSGFVPIIADHHQPAGVEYDLHMNPLLEGVDGSTELSGAGTAYVLARALSESNENCDLAGLAVVGAVGDMQIRDGSLCGANRSIVTEGIDAGVIVEATDLSMYGTQTRPLPKLLEYSSDITIPGISNDPRGTIEFLNTFDINLKNGDGWRCWADLSVAEKQLIASGLVKHGIEHGVPAGKLEQLIGTSYLLVEESTGTELRDASEFSTLLNATARYERADVGLAVCLGDRGDGLEAARRLLRNHRRNLSEGLNFVKRTGVQTKSQLQWFHAEDQIPDTIVGIVAGMTFSASGIDRSRPIIAFADKNESEIKVSGRATHGLVRRGLDLSKVLGVAAREVGGDGGGHNVAAGATIPSGTEMTFLDSANDLIADQLE